jgi:tetratricopeptide (TPR) repeat protein
MKGSTMEILESAKEDINKGLYDSAVKKLESLVQSEQPNSKTYIDALLQLSMISWQRGAYVETVKRLEKLEQLALDNGFSNLGAEAIRLRGNAWYDLGKKDTAEECYKKAQILFEKVENKKGIARCLNNLGVLLAERGEYESALRLYKRSLKIHKQLEDKVGISKCLNNIGEIHKSRGDYEEAEKLYQQSLHIDEELGDIFGQGIGWGNLGAVSFAKKDYKEAEKRIQNAIDIFEKLGTYDVTYVEIYGSMVGIKAATKRFDEAKEHLAVIIKAAEEIQSTYSDTICEFYSGLLAQKEANLSIARKHYDTCVKLSISGDTFEFRLLSLIQLIELELQYYRLTFEEIYLTRMKERLDETLELARKTNSYGALSELLLLHALLLDEDGKPKSALEELENAKQLCSEKGFTARLNTVEKHIDRIQESMQSISVPAQALTVEEKVKRLQEYIEDCQRLVLASK